jgi:hypothetical protein
VSRVACQVSRITGQVPRFSFDVWRWAFGAWRWALGVGRWALGSNGRAKIYLSRENIIAGKVCSGARIGSPAELPDRPTSPHVAGASCSGGTG